MESVPITRRLPKIALISHRVALSCRTTSDPRDVAPPLPVASLGRCDSVTVDFVAFLMRLVYHLSRHIEKPAFQCQGREVSKLPIRASYNAVCRRTGRGREKTASGGRAFLAEFSFSPSPKYDCCDNCHRIRPLLVGWGCHRGSAPCQICL